MSIKYRLWLQSDVIGTWNNPHDAREGARAYLEANPDEAHLVHFGAFRSGYSDHPAKPVFSVSGQELIEYLNDVEVSVEEWEE